ncbi:serine/threonine kinase with two-component sensor domain [Candidatus Vecturithrix granuli]|uniref:Serine/threonine kinase with two-component sensor domain n=1 Tax=Vecturithrix granuli TaxID=1499967 RepID=A0A081C1A7_VECG1|nr:serine/threonine kinase with two-component sensor domain [Candidatus Vecturithrix granuli]
MAAYSDIINQLKQKTVYQYHAIQRQAILNLVRTTEGCVPWRLVGEAYDEEQMLPRHRRTNDRGALGLLYFHKFSLRYLFQAYSQAAENAAVMEEYLNTLPGSIAGYYNFYGALLHLAIMIPI